MSLLIAEVENEIQPGFSPAPATLPEIVAVQESPSSSPGSDSPKPSEPKPTTKQRTAAAGADSRFGAANLQSLEGFDHQVQGGIVTFR